jgi:hypothetical protein
VEQLAFRNTRIVFINLFDHAVDEKEHTASMFRVDPETERRMSFRNVPLRYYLR